MDWNGSSIVSAFLRIEIHLSSRARCYCNSGRRRRIVQREISICSDEGFPIPATGRSSPSCAHKRRKTMALHFFQTRFAWRESVMTKPTKELEYGCQHGWAKCVSPYRLTWVSATRSFRDLRNWNIPPSLNFLHRDCTPIPKIAWLRKSSKQ